MKPELSFVERRLVGAFVEKAFTTPEQYPLTLNGAVVACNQKSCRDPVSSLSEEVVLKGLESLRRKGFAILVRAEGSRADRWKHKVGEALALQGKEIAILAELFLRGPQTDGELRQHAGRMVTLDGLEEVDRLIAGLEGRPEPFVERLSAPGRKRGVKFAHTFYPAGERPKEESAPALEDDAEAPLVAAAAEAAGGAGAGPTQTPGASFKAPAAFSPEGAPPGKPAWAAAAGPAPPAPAMGPGFKEALDELRREVAALKERIEELEATFVKFLR